MKEKTGPTSGTSEHQYRNQSRITQIFSYFELPADLPIESHDFFIPGNADPVAEATDERRTRHDVKYVHQQTESGILQDKCRTAGRKLGEIIEEKTAFSNSMS